MHKKAFSLIELSIVLIIIGLLVGSVFTGQKLLSQSKLRSVVTDLERYKVAYNAFFATFEELPGDLLDSSASALFGVTNGTRHAAEPAGDKIIGGHQEASMAFWHLKLAGLISGGYDGVRLTAEVPGVSTGLAKFSDNTAFHFFSFGQNANQWGYGTGAIYGMRGITALGFGVIKTSNDRVAEFAAITPTEGFYLDQKLDDGIPYLGRVLADHGSDVGSDQKCTDFSGYANNYSSGTVEYQLSNEAVACRMMFIM